MNQPAVAAGTGSQTLSRGLLVLELLAEANEPLTIAELADRLGVHRSNAYRLLRTLEERRFVTRDASGRIRLGPKLTVLARGVAPALGAAAQPALGELAYALGMTAFLAVLDGDDVITLATVEPSNVAATVGRHPGVRHPLGRGAPGHAIEALLSDDEREASPSARAPSETIARVRERGYAISHGEVITGVAGVAVPLRIAGEPPAAIAVVHFALPDPIDGTVEALQNAADRVAQNYH